MFPQWKQCHVECDIPDAGIGSEYGCKCDENRGQENGLFVQFNGQWHQIQYGGIHLKREQKQWPKMFKHLCEEIPEQSNIRLQITMIQTAKETKKD